MPIATISFTNEPPRAATIIRARSNVGKAMSISVRRMISIATLPPRNPAVIPNGTPSAKPTTTAARPTCKETRAPQIIRLSRSRPNSSVPRRCFPPAPGPLRTYAENCSEGLKGAHHGARAATRIMMITSTMPQSIGNSFRQRRQRRPWRQASAVGKRSGVVSTDDACLPFGAIVQPL